MIAGGIPEHSGERNDFGLDEPALPYGVLSCKRWIFRVHEDSKTVFRAAATDVEKPARAIDRGLFAFLFIFQVGWSFRVYSEELFILEELAACVLVIKNY